MYEDDCRQELCPYWGGDGRVCMCALMELVPPKDNGFDLGIVHDETLM